jgi:tetratricopeptide (TPR) repeat protein
LARAQAADPRFSINAANAASISEIARRLDGLPLAIELAAARVKMLPPAELLDRLQRSKAVLTGGPSDSVDHHRTLRDAIAWSHDLLDPREQMLFRRLGVFRGFTLETAAPVCELAEEEVFIGIESLLSKSLLHRLDGGGVARFGMLETLRDFAREELRVSGEYDAMARRHAEHFRNLAEGREPQFTSETHRQAMESLSRELDNIRVALRHALDAPALDLGLCLAGSTWRFWESTGQIVEGQQWLESLLESSDGSGAARAKGLTGLAGLAYWQAEFDEAAKRYQEALLLYREAGDRFNEADTLSSLSMTASWAGDPDGGKRFAAEALAIFEDLGAQHQIGMALMAKGFALQLEGKFAESRPLWETALAIARRAGDSQLAVSQVISSAIFRYHEREVGEALRIAVGALEEAASVKNVPLAGWMLEFVAAFAAASAAEDAVRLAGAAHAIRQRAGGGMPIERLGIRDARTAGAKVLDPERLEQVWAEGRGMSLEKAVECAAQLDKEGDG